MTPGTLTAPPPTRPAAAPAREPRPVPVPTPEPKRGGLLLPTTGGAVGVRAYPISRELYREMCEAGLLRREDRVQLIDGQLWEYPMMGHAHWLVLNSLFPLLLRTLPPGWFTTVQSPVVTDDYGEPEPDLAVVRGAISDYARKPTPEEAVVLIEISDSSPRLRPRPEVAGLRRGGGVRILDPQPQRPLRRNSPRTAAGRRGDAGGLRHARHPPRRRCRAAGARRGDGAGVRRGGVDAGAGGGRG